MGNHKVLFRFEEQPEKEVIVTVDSGDTILDAALDNNLHLNHNCGAVCACSTCHVYIDKGMNDLPEISDKEEDFIDRAENPKINSRLGCQCIINSDIEVTIPDQSSIIGH
ncbi:MAG: 2Fe-2S iron-sulfur cluster-binding protein [Bacteroidia bacterium]|jgi:2Fe-2S ferredoxin|nr:2Fe-2S iron-sulfur cluster-binding protein [Bacteroidia bacterium]MDG2042890.1 2Fe-2S iron-sulfur cluster-binding protein [Bacteroidia bacterium]|tara:strand:- start:1898 stop:2227 length:330 start_codon:yes stop_codon:yes gene_type:complete